MRSHWKWILGFTGALAMASAPGYDYAARASGAPEPESERAEMSRSELDEAFAQAAAHLEAFLGRARVERYLLLDASFENSLAERLKKHGIPESRQVRLPFKDTEDLRSNPLLIHVAPSDAPLLREALEVAFEEAAASPLGNRHVCAWLLADGSLDAVAKALVKHGRQRRPGHTDVSLFRFYDPRVMCTLHRMLQPDQMAALLGPVTAWAYLDYRPQWRVIDNPGNPAPRVFTLELAQIQQLELNARIQKALGALLEYRAEWEEGTDAELAGYVAQARSQRLDDESDEAAYAAMRWLIARRRTEPALLEKALQMHREEKIPLRDVIDHFSPELLP